MEGFDLHELDDFGKSLLRMAEKTLPRESKKFVNKEGTKLRRVTLKTAKGLVKKDTGGYFKGIKKGKVYKWSGNGALSVRVYGASPNSHLIEYGHRQVTHNGVEVGFVPGKRVFEAARNAFDNTYTGDCDQFIDELLDRGLL